MNSRLWFKQHWPLILALCCGLGLRVALWGNLPRLGLISDEAEYLAAADWLANGRGFAWHTGYLWTRAPLYPLFLAAHIVLFGRNEAVIFASQSLLSLVNVGLVYVISRQLGASSRTAGGAALLSALSLPLAMYPQLLLSETLFICLLLAAFWLLARPHHRYRIFIAGFFLGLATLTRGLLLGFLPLVTLWIFWRTAGNWRQRTITALLPLLSAGCLIGPWAVYASRTYGGPIIIDTTSAYNLALGARTAYDGGRSDAPTRNLVLALLDPTLDDTTRIALTADSCLAQNNDSHLQAVLTRPVTAITQAERQQLLTAEGWCLIRAKPWAFVAKTLIELIDLFQINYSGDERLVEGFALGRLPEWYTLALFVLDDTLYIVALPLAVLGWATLKRGRSELAWLIGLWLLYNLAAAPLLFAINRFRTPLLPFLFIMATTTLAAAPRWRMWLVDRRGLLYATFAVLTWLIAATPYAYLEPRADGAPSQWASYFGPYPSALAATQIAWQRRPQYHAFERLAEAVANDDLAAWSQALADPDLPPYARAIGEPLLAARNGQPTIGLELLAQQQPLYLWQAAVIRGELLRHMGDLTAARQILGQTLVDDWNPTDWAWRWLHPPPLPNHRIDLADDNDLGYIDGFYLGEFDPILGATVRWAGETAHLRFPAAASGRERQLCLRAAANWPVDLSPPTLNVWLYDTMLGRFRPQPQLQEFCLPLPAQPAGTDYVITITGPGFIPDALDLVRRQGPQVGQLRILSFQLDWAEVR